ncbi:ABC transporter permease [Coprothermobacteraceae bacterium]|nr:ABC transporter permease [Coprothermobacteraceae bacterium]
MRPRFQQSLNRAIREIVWAWRLIRRNVAQGVILAALIVIAVLIVGLMSSVTAWFQRISEAALGQLQTVIFVQKDLSDEEIKELKVQFAQRSGVAEVRYVSPEDALSALRSSMPQYAWLFEHVDRSPIPPSFEVRFTSLDAMKTFLNQMRTATYVTDVLAPYDQAQSLSVFLGGARRVVWIALSILAAVLAILAMLLVESEVLKQRESLALYALLGATESFLFMPFFLYISAFAALGAIAGLALGFYAGPVVINVVNTINGLLFGFTVELSGWQFRVILGALLAIVFVLSGTFLALRRSVKAVTSSEFEM